MIGDGSCTSLREKWSVFERPRAIPAGERSVKSVPIRLRGKGFAPLLWKRYRNRYAIVIDARSEM